jgi:hypothetical protein
VPPQVHPDGVTVTDPFRVKHELTQHEEAAVNRPMAGWILFASIMMLVIGTLDFFEGLIAVVRDNYYVVTANQLLVFDISTWGWVTMIWGIVLVLAGFALMSGSSWARWFTILLAGVNILAQLGWLGSTTYPLWTLVIIGLNVIVLYALTARWTGYPEEAAATRG